MIGLNILDEQELLTLITKWYAERGISEFDFTIYKHAGEKPCTTENTISDLEDRIAELEDEISNLEDRIAELEDEIYDLEQENSDLQDQLKATHSTPTVD